MLACVDESPPETRPETECKMVALCLQELPHTPPGKALQARAAGSRLTCAILQGGVP